jgi:hypothetical protein
MAQQTTPQTPLGQAGRTENEILADAVSRLTDEQKRGIREQYARFFERLYAGTDPEFAAEWADWLRSGPRP